MSVIDLLEEMGREISIIKKEVDYIKEFLEDSRLTEEEKRMIDKAVKAKKEGKLFTSREVFREWRFLLDIGISQRDLLKN